MAHVIEFVLLMKNSLLLLIKIHCMKKITYLLFISLLAFSCGKKDNVATSEKKAAAEKSLEEKMQEHTEKELASGVQNDTIVLDFVFGMTKRAVYKHTKKLYAKDKKMYPIQKTKKVREYVYDLRLRKAGKLRTFFDAFYYDNKKLGKEELYKVECLPSIDATQFKPKDVIDEIKSIFENEYGNYHFVEPNREDENCKTYIWINGNQKIELGCFEDKVFIYYTDIPVAKLAAKASDL
jgi:hypothetical protein